MILIVLEILNANRRKAGEKKIIKYLERERKETKRERVWLKFKLGDVRKRNEKWKIRKQKVTNKPRERNKKEEW